VNRYVDYSIPLGFHRFRGYPPHIETNFAPCPRIVAVVVLARNPHQHSPSAPISIGKQLEASGVENLEFFFGKVAQLYRPVQDFGSKEIHQRFEKQCHPTGRLAGVKELGPQEAELKIPSVDVGSIVVVVVIVAVALLGIDIVIDIVVVILILVLL